MPEANQALVEGTGDHQAFRHRLDKRPINIDGGASNRSNEGCLPIPAPHRKSRVIRLPKCAGQEPPLPTENLEWLPCMTALADDQ